MIIDLSKECVKGVTLAPCISDLVEENNTHILLEMRIDVNINVYESIVHV